MTRSVWNKDCRSWYKNAQGVITAVWSGSVPHYIEIMDSPRFEDYDWQYLVDNNRWSFMGNGFSQRETLGADLAWYIRSNDDAVPLGKRERFVFDHVSVQKVDQPELPHSAVSMGAVEPALASNL